MSTQRKKYILNCGTWENFFCHCLVYIQFKKVTMLLNLQMLNTLDFLNFYKYLDIPI